MDTDTYTTLQDFATDDFRSQSSVTKSRHTDNVTYKVTYVWGYSVWYDCSMDHGYGFSTKAKATQAAYRAHTALVFNTRVRQYTGPLDLSHVEAPCVDCGKSVPYATIDMLGRETCPEFLHQGGHRVKRNDLEAWEYLVKVATAKALLPEQV